MSGNQIEVKKCSGYEFFEKLEESLGYRIPKDIKKILLFNCYDSAVTLSKLDETSIKDMENVLRYTLKQTMLADDDTIGEYLCRFKNDQTNFQFIGGQLKILKSIAEYCQQLLAKDNVLPATTGPLIVNRRVDTTLDLDLSLFRDKDLNDELSLFKRIGSQLITVFNDAKRITLSAWSWPSRQVASEFSKEFQDKGNLNDVNVNFRYLTPSHHADLLNTIVQVDLPNLRSKIENAAAISLRVDGSVDRTQEHNIYVVAHVVSNDLTLSTVFLGFSVPQEGGNAISYHKATKGAVTNVMPWSELFARITSLVTDGENLNTGNTNGLWAKMKEDRNQSISNIPLLLIWCVAHRINLAWKDLYSDLTVIHDIIKDAKNLSSYFHASGERTRKLKNISLYSPNEFQKFVRYPAYFEIRWTEFTHRLFTSVLRNWKASIQYFENEKEVGLKTLWLNYDRMHLLSFITDVLTLVKAFQKSCESDSVTLAEVLLMKNKLFAKLEKLKKDPLVDGWEHSFLSSVDLDDNSFHGYTLWKMSSRGRLRNRKIFDFKTRTLILDKLVGFTNNRLDSDIATQEALQPLYKISQETSVAALETTHSIIAPDLDKNEFIRQYLDAAELFDSQVSMDYEQKLKLLSTHAFITVRTGLARALAAKPHSADVERLIHVYNQFKDVDRSSLSPISLFNYLYINTNMKTLEEFDPSPAAKLWVNKKRRRPQSNTTSTTKEQEWFTGVFPAAEKRRKTKEDAKIKF